MFLWNFDLKLESRNWMKFLGLIFKFCDFLFHFFRKFNFFYRHFYYLSQVMVLSGHKLGRSRSRRTSRNNRRHINPPSRTLTPKPRPITASNKAVHNTAQHQSFRNNNSSSRSSNTVDTNRPPSRPIHRNQDPRTRPSHRAARNPTAHNRSRRIRTVNNSSRQACITASQRRRSRPMGINRLRMITINSKRHMDNRGPVIKRPNSRRRRVLLPRPRRASALTSRTHQVNWAFIVRLIDWLTLYWLILWLIDWLIDRSIVWFFDWLIDCLIDCFSFILFQLCSRLSHRITATTQHLP